MGSRAVPAPQRPGVNPRRMRCIRPVLELNLGRCPQAACTAALLLLLLTLSTLSTAPPALAEIAPASVIDGPSPTILDVDGAAMAPDGSGGILYRKLVAVETEPGVFAYQPHLFVARFV